MGIRNKIKDNPHDFTTGNIFGKLVKFMLPVLGALVLQAMYSAADTWAVGKFGGEGSVSAVSTGSSLINMVVFVLAGLAMGVTVLMGRYIGEGRPERLGRVIGGAIVTFGCIALVMMAAVLIFAPFFARVLQAPPNYMDKTILYMRICGGGLFFIVGYNLTSSIFRGLGNSYLPLLFVGIACIINVGLDVLLVAGFKMDVAGAAIATVVAQAISLISSVLICKKIQLPFHISWSDLRFSSEVRRFTLSGLPMAFQELLTQFSFLALLAFINGMGTTEAIRQASSDGYGVATKMVSVVMLVPSALMQSMASFIAQNVGAGKEKRAQKAMGYGMLLGGGIGIVMTLAAYFGGDTLASFFTKDATIAMKAAEYMQGFALEAIITSVLFSYIGYFSGHNKTVFVMIQGLAQSFLIRLPMAFLMTRMYPDSMFYVGTCAPTATVFGILINSIYFLIYTRKFHLEGSE